MIQAYKEASEEVYEIIKNITEQNFVKQLELFFDREAYLAEIYFYLKEGGGLLEVDKNILDVVNKEYILSYYTHLESAGAQNSISEPILKVWLNREYSKAFNKRFSN
ncbi:hypothetical protein JWS91_002663 [Enterococcus faecalis]|nr:hypothetical protein [Enterococcus faecalis]EHB6499331.1 hypothetical protein [Enterococcus faecalis]